MLFRVACQNTAAIRDAYRGLRSSARSKGEPRAFRHARANVCACVFSPLLYIDLYPCVSQCQGERRGWDAGRGVGRRSCRQGRQDALPSVIPDGQGQWRRVTSRDAAVTQLVAKGNPRLWSLGNPFSPYCRRCRSAAVLLPPLSHLISPHSLSRVHVPLLNEFSPPFPFLALSPSSAPAVT